MRISLLGREADDFAGAFPGHDVSVVDLGDLDASYDIAFCMSLTQLVPPEKFSLPKHGCWVSHSADLPQGRGWAPLQWSVLKGLPHITVTIFKVAAGVDDGPWAYKEAYPIERTDTIADLYAKDNAVTARLLNRLLSEIEAGTLCLHEQDGEASYWRKRCPEDSELDPSQPLDRLWDAIRICDNERYPAFFKINGKRVYLRYEVER